jgi:3',5'-nucleoside bisphosphate phosphatase
VSRVDLHIHSSISDGRYSPAELVRKSSVMEMILISITDHDNVDGVAPALAAARNFPSLTVIPGVEISTDTTEGEVHVLGYFIDYTYPELLSMLETMRDSRQKRAEKMVAKLAELGLPVDWHRVQEIAGVGSIGRPHIAQALLEKGHITTLKEAFDKYIAFGGPAYVEREKLDPAGAVALLVRAGGLPVLAHPLLCPDPETMVAGLKEARLAGIEAYYGDYSTENTGRLARLAEKYGLITTGGSDYHGLDESAETMIGGADMPQAVVRKLVALAEKRLLKPAKSPLP